MAQKKVNEKILLENVVWNIEQIAVQYKHATEVRGKARSGYYKISIILACSIVEALAYVLLQRAIARGIEMPVLKTEYFDCQLLPKCFISDNNGRLVICKKRTPIFKLDTLTTFKEVNIISKKVGLFSKRLRLYNKLERIRQMRNKIHLQGLGFVDKSYTRKDLEYVSSAIEALLKMLL